MSKQNRRAMSVTATARLKQDYMRIMKDPVPYITAQPLSSNILEWHYLVRGPGDSPYEGGIYHGKLVFPQEFPFKPPAIYMITPNGRFKCNTRLCLSISDFHPDTWNPAWSVSTILTGLLSFMLEKSPTLGSVETSDYVKRQLAADSVRFNLNDKIIADLFPEVVVEMKAKIRQMEEEMAASLQQSAAAGNRNSNPTGQNIIQNNDNNAGFLNNTLTNIIVIVGFAAFACTVQFVLKSIAE